MKIITPILFSLLLSILPARGEVISFAASDSLQGPLRPVLEAYAEQSEISLDMKWPGSFLAKQSFRQENVDVAIIALPPGSETGWLADDVIMTPFGYQPILFGVGPDNPVNALSLDQINGIFGVGERENLGRWGEVGGRGVWLDRPFNLALPRGKDAIGTDFFRHRLLRRGQFRAGASFYSSMPEAQSFVRNNAGAIVLFSRFPDFENVKILSLQTEEDGTSFSPTDGNLHFGDYPLSIPFVLLYRDEAAVPVLEFITFLLGDEAEDALRSVGLRGVPASVRLSLIPEIPEEEEMEP